MCFLPPVSWKSAAIALPITVDGSSGSTECQCSGSGGTGVPKSPFFNVLRRCHGAVSREWPFQACPPLRRGIAPCRSPVSRFHARYRKVVCHTLPRHRHRVPATQRKSPCRRAGWCWAVPPARGCVSQVTVNPVARLWYPSAPTASRGFREARVPGLDGAAPGAALPSGAAVRR